ncbi:hypothetical protein [Rhodoblastus sp.]
MIERSMANSASIRRDFTNFGVESLIELIKIHREMTPCEKR